MTENKPHVVIFGAGMTGRGHIGQLAFEGGWKITFVDKKPELVETLSQAGRYTVRMISDNPRDVVISDYGVFHIDDKAAISEAIAKCDMVITAVLAGNLPDVAPVLAEGLSRRLMDKTRKPLNIIAAENVNEGSSALWSLTSKYLSIEERREYGCLFGFPNSMVARVVPRSSDPLVIPAEDYNEWTAELPARVGGPLLLNGLEWVPNQEARLKRKLYIHNTGHAVCAYLGVLKGYGFIHEAAQDEWVLSCVRKSIVESSRAVGKAYGFDDSDVMAYANNLLNRLPKDALPDSIDRVIREPIRKLGIDDRFIGPLKLCEKYGLPLDGLCLGIAAVLAANTMDTEGLKLASVIRDKGPVAALSEVSGYAPDAESEQAIQDYYSSLLSRDFSSI